MKFQIKPSNKTTKNSILFLDKSSTFSKRSEKKIDIILSPSLYWFREEVLPVKSIQQAKKLAPSIFDAVIPEGIYNYHIQKNGDTFWLFAVDESLIAQTITDSGIRLNQIKNVYLAQNECIQIDKAIKLNENFIIINNEGIVSLLPSRYTNESIDSKLFLETHKLSKHKISINLFQSNFLDSKQIHTFIAISIAFIIIYLTSFIMQQQQYKKILKEQHVLKESFKLPETSFQLNGLIKALESKERRQLNFRTEVKKIFKLSLKRGDYIQKLEANMKKFTLEIVMKDASHAEAIKNQLIKSIRITSAKVKKNIFYISGTHE